LVARALLRAGVGRALGVGFGIRRADDAESIEDLLRSILGRPVVIGVFLGPPRANRKPVLQIHDEQGRLLAIAKIGLNPLTRALAISEAAALAEVGTRRSGVLCAPELLHFGEWRGHTVLVQSALDLIGAPVRIDDGLRIAAMRELAESNGVRTTSWRASSYLARLMGRIDDLADQELLAKLRQAVAGLANSESRLAFGTWHGDWTSWNMAVRDNRALVWDWERYEKDVPVGFDALHFAFMPALKASSGSEHAALELVAGAAQTLRPFAVSEEEAGRIAFTYILDLATRYLADRQGDTGVRGGVVAQWLEPVLDAVHNGGILEMVDRHG
jgi:hypothetical protein